MAFDRTIVERVLALALARAPARGQTRILALSGAQGSGKSTLAAQVVAAARASGRHAAAASLDDFYLDRPAREALAASVHPLFVTRGVPGTHDLPLMHDVFEKIHAGEPLRLPVYDKGSDARLPEDDWRQVDGPLDLFVFEGWCLGVGAQSEAALATPVNALESEEDPQAVWRRHVNACLARDYPAIWSQFDTLVMLRAPSFAIVADWRDQAEAPLRAADAPRAMNPQQMRRFVMHYQRLTEHALAMLQAQADLVLRQDDARRVVDVTAPESLEFSSMHAATSDPPLAAKHASSDRDATA
jgi:D-glycerate 3-kinase